MITIRDIAKKTHLSAMTVSRALRGQATVSEETRRKVEVAAAELGYRKNRWAASFSNSKSHIVGVVVPDISHTFYSQIVRGIQKIIEPAGYNVVVSNTNSSPAAEQSTINTLLESRVAGIVIASDQPYDEPEWPVGLQGENVIFVLIIRFFRGMRLDHVRADDKAVGDLAAKHLIELGHHDIGCIIGPNVSSSVLRVDGFKKHLRKNRICLRDEWIVNGRFSYDGGADAMKRLLELRDRPTAVFAVNDPSAVGAVNACRERGVEVPAQMSIIGAGNIEGSADHLDPFLTTIDWPRAEIGERAAEILLSRLNGIRLRKQAVTYQPNLLVRRSTGLFHG